MKRRCRIGDRWIGDGHPCFIIGEIGINHNGDPGIARELIEIAARSGCDAVKFQKRTPEICVPSDQKDLLRETPWGMMTYLEYRHRVEFGQEEYAFIDSCCRENGIEWFASCWDEPSVDFIERFEPVCYKVPSARLTDDGLLQHIRKTGRPVILSTGMSTMEEIEHALSLLDAERLIVTHCTSTYPCKADEINLRMLETLRRKFPYPIGYSGHEAGLTTTHAAAALGACVIERHITLDRTMWGSDHAASVEPWGLARLVRDIRVIETALGDGVKKVYPSELSILQKLRNDTR